MQKITIPLGGEDRRIKFTINAIQELEAQIDGKNVMLLMQDRVWSVTDIVSACHCALRTFDNTITRRKVQEWVAEYAEEHETGIYDLQAYLTAALGMSGLVGGKRSAFEGVLAELAKKKEGEKDETADKGK